jgi:hypothetical protein
VLFFYFLNKKVIETLFAGGALRICMPLQEQKKPVSSLENEHLCRQQNSAGADVSGKLLLQGEVCRTLLEKPHFIVLPTLEPPYADIELWRGV